MERTVRIPAAMRAPVRRPKRRLALRPDDQLVALVRAGDAAAFEVLYERYAAAVLGFCRHMLGSQEEAEDAVQQAFVSAHGALLRGGSDVAFKPWLYTIARNRCVSMLRARREQPSELPELSTAGLSEEVERRSDLRELVHDVQRLPEQQRAALLLSELEDLSHAEVAEVIGVAPHKVKALVFRARSALGERQEARAADCGEIRVELAAAKGGGLRRGRLRYHLESCPACAAYLDEVRRQRRLLGVALPVVPALALKESVMREVGLGGAAAAGAVGGGAAAGGGGVAAGGGGAAGGVGALAGGGAAVGGAAAGGAAAGAGAVGGALLGGAAVKVAVGAALLVGGAGVATEVVRDGGERPAGGTAPPSERRPAADGSPAAADPSPAPGVPATRALERRGGARGAERRALGQRRAAERSGGKSAAGERGAEALAPGRARGLGAGRDGQPGRARGREREGVRPDAAAAPPAARSTPAPRGTPPAQRGGAGDGPPSSSRPVPGKPAPQAGGDGSQSRSRSPVPVDPVSARPPRGT